MTGISPFVEARVFKSATNRFRRANQRLSGNRLQRQWATDFPSSFNSRLQAVEAVSIDGFGLTVRSIQLAAVLHDEALNQIGAYQVLDDLFARWWGAGRLCRQHEGISIAREGPAD